MKKEQAVEILKGLIEEYGGEESYEALHTIVAESGTAPDQPQVSIPQTVDEMDLYAKKVWGLPNESPANIARWARQVRAAHNTLREKIDKISREMHRTVETRNKMGGNRIWNCDIEKWARQLRDLSN